MTPSRNEGGLIEIVESIETIEFDIDTGRFRAAYDVERDSASLAVVTVVAAAANSDPTELAPLHFTVDTGALDALFGPSNTAGQRFGSTSFQYEGFTVTVFSEGTVEVGPPENG